MIMSRLRPSRSTETVVCMTPMCLFRSIISSSVNSKLLETLLSNFRCALVNGLLEVEYMPAQAEGCTRYCYRYRYGGRIET